MTRADIVLEKSSYSPFNPLDAAAIPKILH